MLLGLAIFVLDCNADYHQKTDQKIKDTRDIQLDFDEVAQGVRSFATRIRRAQELATQRIKDDLAAIESEIKQLEEKLEQYVLAISLHLWHASDSCIEWKRRCAPRILLGILVKMVRFTM